MLYYKFDNFIFIIITKLFSYLRKAYRDIDQTITTMSYGVVAKPGIATGSRSKNRAGNSLKIPVGQGFN